MKTIALIEMGKDGTFGIYTPNINSTIIGEGITVTEAKSDFENSVREIIEAYTEQGDPLPDELKDIEFEYKYDIASFFNYYNWINVSKFAQAIGINDALMRQYKAGTAYISERQTKKIEAALHQFGKELTAVRL
jgi:predicted RNase H-like HicB family nuclease